MGTAGSVPSHSNRTLAKTYHPNQLVGGPLSPQLHCCPWETGPRPEAHHLLMPLWALVGLLGRPQVSGTPGGSCCHPGKKLKALGQGGPRGLVPGPQHCPACPSLTFDQGMLVRGGGASQHPQLWPDLIDPLLLDLERDGGGAGRWGRGEKARPR